MDVSSKGTKKIKYKNRTIHPLKSKQILQVASSHENNSKTEKPLLKTTVTNTIVAPGKGESTEPLITDKKADNKTKNNCETTPKNGQPGTKTTVKKLGVTKQQPPKKQKISSEELRENLVCLTQEQLQQILASVSQANKTSNQKQERDKSTKAGKGVKEIEATDKELKKGDNPNLLNGIGCSNNEASRENSSCQEPQVTKTSGANVEQANSVQTENTGNKETSSSATNQTKDGLFGNLGERENAKDQLEAKRIQWKKELDEQVALKKQLQERNEASEFLEWNPWGRRGAGTPMQSNTKKILETLKGKASITAASGLYADSRVISTAPTVTNASNTDVPSDGTIGKASSFSFPDLPAAIRSAFVLGEISPQDHLFSAIKREQQKKWLQELDKQREEEKNRKLKEKLKYSEGDHHSRWAMHFDSYHKKAHQQTPVSVNVLGSTLETSPASGNQQPNILKMQQFPALASPLLGQHNSSAGEDMGFMVGDTGSDLSNKQKSSFLRSMTALLDPAEIEERDIRRKKQLEHQKAIAIQVEERRRQRQLEEDHKRKEEQKEELRLAKERERLRQQYEEETRTQREKEELHNLKTSLLYETVQKAQEEAKRQKQEQRIKNLVRKGHDISNLQNNVEGTVCEMGSCAAPSNLVREAISEELGQTSIIEESSRKDRGIQTEEFELNGKIECGIHDVRIIDHGQVTTTSDAATEHNEFNNNHTKKKSKTIEKMTVTGKENCLQSDDLYNQFARTKKGKNEKRPEWNTNKTTKRYIPASQRYPKGLQMEREEKKMKRQMEMLQLLEKNAPDQRSKKKQTSKELSTERLPSPVVPALQAKMCTSSQPVEKQGLSVLRKEEPSKKSNSSNKLPVDKVYSCGSPPVPALRNKQLQMEEELPAVQNVNPGAWYPWAPLAKESENDGPSSFNFVPYVRTDEVYHLDPDAPMSRPSTDDPQYKRCSVTDHLQHQSYSFDHTRDPLLNPDLLRNRERQQAILKGLSELRQGLMQKQRELETASPMHQEDQSSGPLQHS
ncbi:coiled-coil domain-containing protein 66 isoform X2 [Pristis pectinata]|uniref:coiled-coil domain-containing protein 66 isoform X2 n=1 Tax=Pristis pectinata TaxID=685728 RepID=UPI00223D45FF|nr:coiled-coil domain-containing protein 66 isoform X2 [Pristis pectinata]